MTVEVTPIGQRVRPQKAWQLRKLAANQCRDCGRPLWRGGRCWKHYVLRYAARHRIGRRWQWFVYHETEFLYTLRGRYRAIAAGEPVGPIADIIALFEQGAHRVWCGAKNVPHAGTQQARLAQIVRHFDHLATREAHSGRGTDVAA
jgi:hypothetical protein